VTLLHNNVRLEASVWVTVPTLLIINY